MIWCEGVLVATNSVRRFYESIEIISDICPTADISFPLKLTKSMSLGMMSVSGMLLRRKVEEKIRFVTYSGSTKTRAAEKFATCKEIMSASLCKPSRLPKS